MPVRPIKKTSDLKKRIDRFFSSSLHGRGEVSNFLSSLEDFGEAALFGGMLRDLSLASISEFNSDIDIVVNTENPAKLEQFLTKLNAQKNKFGGYRLTIFKWKLDIWELNTTWAFKHGYASGQSLEDLCKTTFFDWDGIIYHLNNAKIIAVDAYLDRLHSKIIDINLCENPNPIGNTIKAIRYCVKYDAKLSQKLARYVYHQMRHLNSQQISLFERTSHDRPVLDEQQIDNLLDELSKHQDQYPLLPFEPNVKQHTLWQYNS